MVKIDKLDVINIKKEADKLIKTNSYLRKGQAIYIATNERFNVAANKLAGTEKDCYYEDSRIQEFLDELLMMDAE